VDPSQPDDPPAAPLPERATHWSVRLHVRAKERNGDGGINHYFSSAAGRSKRGQEVSILGVVATVGREAFGIDVTQTPAGLSGNNASEEYSAVEFYIKWILDLHGPLAEMGISHWVGDGFYAKRKVFGTVTDFGTVAEMTETASPGCARLTTHRAVGPPGPPGSRSTPSSRSAPVTHDRSRSGTRWPLGPG
jgi:hypothetical protein